MFFWLRVIFARNLSILVARSNIVQKMLRNKRFQFRPHLFIIPKNDLLTEIKYIWKKYVLFNWGFLGGIAGRLWYESKASSVETYEFRHWVSIFQNIFIHHSEKTALDKRSQINFKVIWSRLRMKDWIPGIKKMIHRLEVTYDLTPLQQSVSDNGD